MEIPEAIRKELLEAGGIMTPEDFSNLIYDLNKKAKKSKKSSVSAVSNSIAVGSPRTKFTYLCTKTADVIKGNRSLVDEFKAADNNKKRIVLIMREAEEMVGEELKNVFCRKLARANKNHAIVKEEGNFYFKKENYALALDMYSTALRLALVPPPALQEWKVVTETPQGIVTETVVVGGDEGGGGGNGEGNASGDSTSRDIDASVCLAARSAVHYQTHDYESCIKDIDASTWFGCPAHLEKTLESRRELCEQKLKHKWAGLAKAAAAPKGGAAPRGVSFMALAEFEDSEKIRLVSQYMDFCEPEKGKEERGRFTKAKMNVEAGEILLVERPFAFCLAFSSSADNCHFCCRPLSPKTFLPSPLEEGVLLCSVDCLEYAMDGFHAWESKVNLCRMFEVCDEDEAKDRIACVKFDSVAGSSILALRSILAHPVSDWIEVEKNLEKPPSSKAEEKAKKKETTTTTGGSTGRNLKYLAMNTSLSLLPSISSRPSASSSKKQDHNKLKESFDTAEDKMKLFNSLESHRTKRDWAEYLNICSRALLLVKFLEEIGYLDDDNCQKTKEAMGNLLVRMMEALQHNIHLIDQLDLASGELMDIGSALYPLAARYLNHSCDPNTLRVNLGNNVVFVARRNIKAGEEITDNYGPHFHRDEKGERMNKLKEYRFKCSCAACTKDYSVLRYLDGDLKPGQANQVQQTMRALKEALDSKRTRKEDQVQAKIRQYHQQVGDFKLTYPHRSHAVGGILVANSFWQLLGNKKTD